MINSLFSTIPPLHLGQITNLFFCKKVSAGQIATLILYYEKAGVEFPIYLSIDEVRFSNDTLASMTYQNLYLIIGLVRMNFSNSVYRIIIQSKIFPSLKLYKIPFVFLIILNRKYPYWERILE
jgi:hypothetical protein